MRTPPAPLLALGLILLSSAPPARAEDTTMTTLDFKELATLGAEARRQKIEGTPKEALAEALRQAPAEVLLAICRKALGELGTYKVRLTKSEKVDGKMIGPQTMQLEIRESPMALKGEVTAGPAKGRKLLYNQTLRADELRVKEAGLLGLAGAIWVGKDSSLTRKDTRHPVTDLGYGPLLALLAKDLETAKASGGHARKDEGFDAKGGWCILFTAAPGAKNLYAPEARVCFDPKSGLMTRVEVYEKAGLFERFDYELLQSRLKRTDADFTPEGAGL